MNTINTMVIWVKENWGLLATLIIGLEQVLAATSVKSNSTFQLVCNLVDKFVKKPNTSI